MVFAPFRLKATLASDRAADPDDVRRLKSALAELGDYVPPEWGIDGYPDRGLFESLTAFQRRSGLKSDGPTQQALNMLIAPLVAEHRLDGRDGFDLRTKDWRSDRGDVAPPVQPMAAADEEGGEGGRARSSRDLPQHDGLSAEAPTGKLRSQRHGAGNDPTEMTPQGVRRAPVLTDALDRRNAILQGDDARFVVAANPQAEDSADWWEFGIFSEVEQYDELIEAEAKRQGVDPDLVRAIVHMETSRGQYDRLGSLPFFDNDSMRPMNVHVEFWKGLGYTRDQLRSEPESNIRAGVRILREIRRRMPDASVEAVASVYNFLGAEKVTDYGARVARIYRERLWE
jgi:hypothetical protein